MRQSGRPPGSDSDRTKTAILDAALEAFADRGFDGASIREITGAAGVGHNLARHYFGSKEDLWRATMRHALGPPAAQLAAILRSGQESPAEQTMRAGVEVLVSAIEENPAAIRLLVAEALRGGPRFDEIFDDVISPIGEVVLSYFGTTREGITEADPRVISLFVFAAVYGSFSLEGILRRLDLAQPDGRLTESAADDLVELVLGGLRGRPRRSGPAAG